MSDGDARNTPVLAGLLSLLFQIICYYLCSMLCQHTFALGQAHFEYCIIIQGHSYSSIKLFKLQIKAIRIMAKVWYRIDCKQCFKSLKILTIPCLYIIKRLEHLQAHTNSYHNNDTKSNDICISLLKLTRTRYGFNYYCIR